MDRAYDMDDIDEDDIDAELAEIENDMQIQGMMGNQQNANQQQHNPLMN